MAKSMRGVPRYLEGREEIENPRMWEMLHWVRSGVLKKKIWDLELLTEGPSAKEKQSKMDLRVEASWTEGWPNSMLSSMNCWCEMGGH